jgi:hypothetical protein
MTRRYRRLHFALHTCSYRVFDRSRHTSDTQHRADPAAIGIEAVGVADRHRRPCVAAPAACGSAPLGDGVDHASQVPAPERPDGRHRFVCPARRRKMPVAINHSDHRMYASATTVAAAPNPAGSRAPTSMPTAAVNPAHPSHGLNSGE